MLDRIMGYLAYPKFVKHYLLIGLWGKGEGGKLERGMLDRITRYLAYPKSFKYYLLTEKSWNGEG